MNALQSLLHPYSVEAFLAQNWTTKAIAISGNGQRRFSHLFSWEALNELLNFHLFKYPDLRLVLDEAVLEEAENAHLAQWCQQGATLILNQVQKRVPAIAQFAAELRQDFGFSTQVNAYSSYPNRQGFSCHYDTHEVFILQIEGSKQWYVFHDTVKYPLPEQKSAEFSPPTEQPYLSCTLDSGDVLYIPRGHWHPTLGERYQSYLDSLGQPVRKYDFPRQAGFDHFPHGMDTQFQCAKFQPIQVIELPECDGFRILMSGKEVLLRGVTATLVEHLFQHQSVTGRDVLDWLPGYDWEIDVMPLLSRLIIEGILFVEAGIRDG